MPAVSSSPILTVVDDSDPLLGELAEVPPAPDGLLELLAQVADPRKPRGIRHGLTGVLAMALSAVITGAQSFVAIAEWAADASPEALARLGVTGTAPSESTIRRCLQRLAPDQLDHLIGAWMWLRTSTIGGRRVIAFDGKTLRGARDAAGNPMHLLAGLCQHTGAVLAQLAVGAKTLTIGAKRLGNSIMAELRGGWSGERLGFDYATDDKRVRPQFGGLRYGLSRQNT